MLARNPKLTVIVVLVAVVATVALMPVAGAQNDGSRACSCEDIGELQAELRNAQRLQRAFQAQIAELRRMGPESARIALQQFANGPARQGLEQTDGSRTGEFDYGARGEAIDEQNWDRHGADELCALSAESMQRLEQAARASRCADIGEALRAHEERHHAFCRAIGYRPYHAMHGADRAAEEVEAYGAQIQVLRHALVRLLERSNARVTFSEQLGGGDELRTEGEVAFNHYAAYENGEMLMRGVGQATGRYRMVGGCSVTSGAEFTEPLAGNLHTDGEMAEITLYQTSMVDHPITFQCFGHGGGQTSVLGAAPPNVTLPLRDGASTTYGLSGPRGGGLQGRVTLEFCRSSG
ncbi:hypothetical protein [Terricaulis silvestris]|uniref:Uncharacterized protein n=1 Tax=Terricaulis silvestris TaxID=2686094 RepID=A0A6I6MJG9_9CAUL|nr:hypothetical protein [Terricaulis silvestris]QGZ95300.1 hypothetical protein DSM104635_02149 [Terricaulis silvestris]